MNDLLWQNPGALWGLWVLPILILTAWHRHVRVRRAARAFAGAIMGPRVLPPLTWHRPALRTALTIVGVGLLIVALARPAWDVYYIKTRGRGVDLLVALDVSRSMLADDAGDSRLGRAKTAISRLVDALEGDRVGLLLFAGQTVRVCPLTLDRGFFRASLRDASPSVAGRGGTLLGPALDDALAMLDTEYDRDQILLLVTDGGDQESFPKTAADRLAKKGMRVLALGLGSSQDDAPLVIDGRPVRRRDGTAVTSRLNEELLMEIASATNGLFVPPERALELPEIYERYIGPLKKGENQEFEEKHYHERYQWFLLPGILALMAAFVLGAYPRRRLAGASAALLLGLGAGCGGHRDAVEDAVGAWNRGDAKRAEELLLPVAEARPEDPIVAFDLACAHQALGRRREAEAEYVRVLERGDEKLRARAYTNQSLLTVDELRRRLGEDPDTLTGAARDEIATLARSAIASLQRARDLDPSVRETTERQDQIARWLRSLEDAWATKDRDAVRRTLEESKGAARIVALVEFVDATATLLRSGGLLEDVLERLRSIDPLLESLPATFADGDSKPAEPLLAALTAAVPAIRDDRAAAEDAASQARVGDAFARMTELSVDLVMLLPLVGEPADAARRVSAAFQASALAAQALSPDAEKDPPAELREVITRRLDRLALGTDAFVRRFQADVADPSWSPRVADRGRAATRSALEESTAAREAWSRREPAHEALANAARSLTRLATEIELAAKAPEEIARQLDAEQASVRALLAAPAEPADVRATVLNVARSGQEDLAARTGYLGDALLKSLEPDPSAPPTGDPSALEDQRRQVQAMMERLTAVVTTGVDAFSDPALGPTAEPLLAAQRALRATRCALGRLQPLLQDAHAESDRRSSLSRALSKESPPQADGSLDAVSLERTRAVEVAEQSLLTIAIQGSRAALMRERDALKARRDAPAEASAGGPSVVEVDGLLAAYDAIEPVLARAEASSSTAMATLSPATLPTDAAGSRALFATVIPEQESVSRDLAEALDLLAKATIPLAQLAERLLAAEDPMVAVLRALQRGEAPSDEGGQPVTLASLTKARERMGELVALLPDALERELSRQTPPPDADPSKPSEVEETEKALRGLVAQVQAAHAESLSRVRGGDPRRSLDSAEASRDAVRRLWMSGADLKPSLQRGIQEEEAILGLTTELAKTEPGRKDTARHTELERDQGALDPLLQHLGALVAKARESGNAAPPGAPPGAPAGASGSGGPSPETLDLAEKNLPAAEAASAKAREALRSARLDAAGDEEREVTRLLKEILEQIEKDEQQQKDQEQPQPQPQPSSESNPSNLSPEELQRLTRMVQERNRDRDRRRDPNQRTPVEEDW